jgi:hypothetical protein
MIEQVDPKTGNVTGSWVYTSGADYNAKILIMQQQENARIENEAAVARYKIALDDAQWLVDNGFPQTKAPDKPLQVVIDDDGNKTQVAFDPPLADLRPAKAALPTQTLADMRAKADAVAPDPQKTAQESIAVVQNAVVHVMVPVLAETKAELDEIKKIVAALAAKAGVAMLIVAMLSILAGSAAAQVKVACSPEPIAVLNALHVKSMGQWACFVTNAGPSVRTLSPEEIYTAIIAVKPIDPASVAMVLADNQSHTTSGKIVKVLSIAGQLSGVALSLASKANAQVGTALAVGSGFLPQVLSVAQGQVPSTAPYLTQLLSAPITLAPNGQPGAALTKTVFAAKQKNPQPIAVTLL